MSRLIAWLGRRFGQSIEVTFYGRSPCGLCDKAEALLAAEVPRAQVTKVDIDADDELLAKFHIRVPVIEVDGKVVAEGAITPGQLRTALTAQQP